MSRSGRQKGNYLSKADRLRDSKDEGTAARTRPFSFDEIMERRKSKESSQNMKYNVGEVEIMPRKDTIEDTSASSIFLKGGKATIRLSSVIERPVVEERLGGTNRNEEDPLHKRVEKSIHGINDGKRHSLEERRYKEEHDSLKEGTHVKGNSAAEQCRKLMSEVRPRNHGGETEKKIQNKDKKDEWHRADLNDRRLRSEIRNIGYRYENEQKIPSRGRNDAQPNNYQQDRMQRNEPRNIGYRSETDKRTNSRSNNNEWPRSNIENHSRENRKRAIEQRVDRRSKADEWSRNDSGDKARKGYSDRIEVKLEKEGKRKHHNANDRDIRDKNTIKKADLRSSRDPEVAEKEKKEPSGHRHEDTRMKRKRSRSQDRGKDRERRSLSPEAQKTMSYNCGRKIGDSSSHSLKDRLGKEHKDEDRGKFSSNGLGNHYRGHGGSTSGLGGYSPRKRKTDNAVKTPPNNRSPEKKSAGWDIPPTGIKDPAGSVSHGIQMPDQLAVSLNVNELVTAVTAALNANKLLPGPSGFFPAKSNVSVESIELTESTRPMRRLYIENVPTSASEKDVMEYLNNHLLSSGVNHIHGKQPCISCTIHKEKGQALVEFLTPEDASAALSVDGSSFLGSMLRIRRPKDFVSVATGDTAEAAKSVGTISLANIVEDSTNKVFIGGISEALSTEMLIEIAGAFGPLKAFYFDSMQDSSSRYAFLEYVDHAVTLKACSGLNGVKLGGQVLTVVQAFPYLKEICERQPTYLIPDHAKPLLQKPTQVIKLKNVFTPEDMISHSKAEIEVVLEDIRLECARFGTVKSLNVVQQETVPHVNDSEENHGDLNIDKVAEVGENMGHGGKVLSETPGEDIETATEGLREGRDEPLVAKSIGLEEYEDYDSLKLLDTNIDPNDQTWTPDVPPKSSDHGSSPLIGHTEYQESKGSETSRIKEDTDDMKESSEGKESNLEQGRPISREATGDLCFGQNGVTEQQDCLFELGSVFVEYKRTEGSCNAAHALHGRLFDERVVMVEYVPLELYRARFPN